MQNIFIFFSLFYFITGKLTSTKICENCLGKIHTREELELVKQPLIINQNEICRNEKYPFMIIVKSGDYSRRNFTRSTWAKEIIEHFNIPVLYALGFPKNSSHQKEIFSENQISHDLLQFPILESYYNLTLKTSGVLFWYHQYCSNNSHYLLYVDDDILIHVDKLIMYINQKTDDNNNHTIEGWLEQSGQIQRTGIGGISKENFPIDIVPNYLWGAAVLYPSKVISNGLIQSIFNTTLPIFFRDDVFINGFLAEQAGINRRYLQGILLYDSTEDDLKSNMIIIDFKTEDIRIKAWNCYRYNIQCNKNFVILFLKIFSGICLVIFMIISCWRYFQTTSYYYQFKYEFNLWYYGRNYPYIKTNHSEAIRDRKQRTIVGKNDRIQWLNYLRNMGLRIVLVCLIIIGLYYIVEDIGHRVKDLNIG
jgi:hypothetical protein